MKTKNIERRLKEHGQLCSVHVFSADERSCSCGRDEAVKEFETLKAGMAWLEKAVEWFEDHDSIALNSIAGAELFGIVEVANAKPS